MGSAAGASLVPNPSSKRRVAPIGLAADVGEPAGRRLRRQRVVDSPVPVSQGVCVGLSLNHRRRSHLSLRGDDGRLLLLLLLLELVDAREQAAGLTVLRLDLPAQLLVLLAQPLVVLAQAVGVVVGLALALLA